MPFNLSLSNFSEFKIPRTCSLNRQLWCEVGHCRGLTSVKRSVQGLLSHTITLLHSDKMQAAGFREGHSDRDRDDEIVTNEEEKGVKNQTDKEKEELWDMTGKWDRKISAVKALL